MNFEIGNTFEAWVACKNQIEDAIQQKTLDEKEPVVISVTVVNNVERLICFFPILDMLQSMRISCRLEIHTDENNKKEDDLEIKIRHFLFVQQLFRGRSKAFITINGESRQWQTRFGEIQPLMSVSRDISGRFCYRYLYHSELDFNLFSDVLKYFVDESFSERDSSFSSDRIDRFRRYIERNLQFYSDSFLNDNAGYFEGEKNRVKWGKLFDIKYDDSVQVVYAKMTLSNVFYCIDALKGQKGKFKLTKNDKKKFANELLASISDVINDMPVLAQYVWSLLLRFQLDARNLIVSEKEVSTFYQSIFDTTLAQAQALADGLYQLIENACLHSKSGVGYYYLRVHKTYISNEMGGSKRFSRIEEHAKILDRLSRKYALLEFSGEIQFYIELEFIDNAFDRNGLEGMVEHFNRNNANQPPAKNLKDLFWRRPETIDDLTVHYGLRVMERTVRMNEGAFMVYTPSTVNYDGGYAYQSVFDAKGTKNEDFISKSPYYHGTLYQIILPIKNAITPAEIAASKKEVPLFDFSDWDNNVLPYVIILDVRTEYNILENKSKNIDMIYQQLEERLGEVRHIDRRFICVYPKGFALNHMELLAKALIRYLLKHQQQKQYFALLLRSRYQIIEFTRTYTAFFDRSGLNYDKFRLENTQIALCWIREEGGEQKQDVCFILSGNDLATARKTVMNYLYYNSQSSIQFFPLVTYLTGFIENGASDDTASPVFPFDLYLDVDLFDSDEFNQKTENQKAALNRDKIWFMRQINRVLDTDMQLHGYGCKLSNVHVSLGSKIHTDTFYNAELIFHNYANIFRFAYMIARDILNEHIASEVSRPKKDRRKNIVMVAYGEYSQLLIQKVCDLINSVNMTYRASFLLFPSYLTEEEQREWRSQGKEFLSFMESEHINEENGLSNYRFYTVVPISTTLSTVKKIHDALERTAKNKKLIDTPDFGFNISLIISGGIEDAIGVEMQYWEEIDEVNIIITIKGGKKVKYYLNKPANWYKAFDLVSKCKICENTSVANRKSLIGVDKSSTLPDAIFDTLDRATAIFLPDKSENHERLKQLYGNVKYSHISGDQNHFLYDIDYENYCIDKKNNQAIRDWLSGKVRPNLKANAFNIIVSPLDSANSRFLKDVIECAFDNSSRVINIKFHTAYRDEIRSKLDFITEEYRQLKTTISNFDVNVYYVDDCIIEGATFQRSRQFLYMLFSDAGLRMDNVNLYKGIILLSNRSSYDTVQNLLCRKPDHDFFYYMRLNVPSFNTQNRICPACTLSEQYRLMKKRASTNIIAGEYERLYHKHLPKSRTEYNKWMDNLLREKGYFSRFKSWLYYAVHVDEDKNDYYIVNINGEKIYCDDPQYPELKKLYDQGLDKILSGEKVLRYEEAGKDMLDVSAEILRKHIIADKDYCRMICTHEIFSEMEKMHNEEAEKKVSAETYESDLRGVILRLIKDKMNDIEKNTNGLLKQTQLWLKAEWIISYFKIISRKQPAHYYHLRNAIYNILINFLDCLMNNADIKDLSFIKDICVLSDTRNIDDSIMPEMKYRIFLTAVRRVSAMHSSYIIENIDNIFLYYQHCSEQYNVTQDYHHFFKDVDKSKDIYHALVEFSSKSLFNLNIAKLTKWSSMYGVDDSKCFIVEDIIGERLRAIHEGKDKDERGILDALKIAFLENTQVIYTGIKKFMMNNFTEKTSKSVVRAYIDRAIEQEIGYLDEGGNEMSTHRPYLRFTKFDEMMKDAALVNAFSERTTRMLMLFTSLCHLEAMNESVDNPYDFVHICNYIRDITDYKQCTIVSYREQKVSRIISSDIAREYFFDDIKEDMLEEILSRYCDNIESDYSIDKVAQKYYVSNKTDRMEVMVVSLLNRSLGDDMVHIPKYYLVLYKNNAVKEGHAEKAGLAPDDLRKLRNVLFLRDRLEIVLEKNIAELIGMISSYDYVKPLKSGRDPKILHISDLHIKAKDKNKNIPDYVELLTEIKDKFVTTKPDLLLITGDVILGNYSAAGLQDTYENALRVIKELALVLWEESGNIRSDWNKRILISVGNHDYASMNELEATNKKRITTAGKPGELGDVMIKHSYFVHFLHRLLGNDIDAIIKNDMNSAINYKKLGLSVININSNSNVNPLRTNKVRINEKAVEKTLANVKLADTIIYMVHHTPIYKIDYVDDVYYLSCDKDKIKKIDDMIQKAYIDAGLTKPKKTVNEIWIALLKSFETYQENKVFDLPQDKQKQLVKDILDIIHGPNPKRNQDDTYDDFSYFIECEFPRQDDRCRHITFELNELEKASEEDQAEYVKFAKNHFTWLMDFVPHKKYIILGGHTHRSAKYSQTMTLPMSGCQGIYEVGRFYEKDDTNLTLNYFIFSVGSTITMEDAPDNPKNDKEITGSILEGITE